MNNNFNKNQDLLKNRLNNLPSNQNANSLPNPNKIQGMPKSINSINDQTFNKAQAANTGKAKQVMNSKGQNLIHNDFRNIKPQ